MHLLAVRLIGQWAWTESIAGGLAILALAVTLGLFAGAIRVRGVKLGISGVLFSALVFGQMGLAIDAKVLEFLRDFALILFMYAIGLEVGPGFVSSLRAEGLKLNLLAVVVLVLGAVMTAGLGREVGRGAVPGLYAGAFTTTPGLAAAQEALRGAHGMGEASKAAAATGLAYSITYPFGIVGPMLVMIALRRVFGVRLDEEKSALASAEEKRRPLIEVVDFEVTEAAQAVGTVEDHRLLGDDRIVLTRMLRGGVVTVPMAETEVRLGDVYRAVGTREHLEELVSAMGRRSDVDLGGATGDVRRLDLVVTQTHVLHRSLHELNLTHRTGVTIANVSRAGVPLIPSARLRLAFGDRVTVVGPQAGLKMVETEFGNSEEKLNRSQLSPIFLGIVLGVLVGSIPLKFPGMQATLRLGLAGGPLLAAIALSQIGNFGPMVWYMPAAANQLFRDFGLAVFLACVGLQAGDHFIQRAAGATGLALLLWGAAITVVPVFIVGCYARLVMKMNFITLAGWVAGAMGSSTALLFADEMTQSEVPAVAYAAVVPLATLVPIVCAQVLAISVL